MNKVITGIDIGGTHITVCKVDLATKEILESSRVRLDINTHESKEDIIQSWAKAIKGCSFLDDGKIGKLGIAMPGPFDYEKGISLITGLNKYESIYGFNVKELLAEELYIPVTDIRMMNDATAFLLGEWKAGSGKGFENIVGLTLGTGLGSANCFNNILEDGDLWQMPFADSRAEDLLCARWFINEYKTRTYNTVANVKELSLMVADDIVAAQLFKEFGNTLGEVLVKRYSGNFPNHIIIGGNIAGSWNLFYPFCEASLQRNGFFCNIVKATLGEDAALLGAACLWME